MLDVLDNKSDEIPSVVARIRDYSIHYKDKKMNIVNLKSYPININDEGEKEDTMRYQSLIKSSIYQLNKQGFVSLPNFLNPTAGRANIIHIAIRKAEYWVLFQ